jgi:hypothetical protein
MGLVVLMLTIIQYALPAHSKVVTFYDIYVFHPFQSVRNVFFSLIPISVGDILYLLGGIMLLILVGRWIFFMINFQSHRHELGTSLLQTMIVSGMLYILFILGWGGNYYKSSLSSFWGLDRSTWEDSTLVQYDAYLIGKLNEYAPAYQPVTFREIDKRARLYYKTHTDSRTKAYGVKVKPSVFGYLMQHLGIQGYYNPFTGEAQVNRFLPSFMLPFVVCHEMAHQSGIAAEDDANLLSYAVSTIPEDPVFRYSAYFNLWLYTHARLKVTDSAVANKLKMDLNPITLAHLDTLRQIRRKYDGDISDYSGVIYDGYLKLHHQKDGIESYNKVAITAWAWEQSGRQKRPVVIALP